jgi:hypothetical protein
MQRRRSFAITTLFTLSLGACSFQASCGGKKLDTKKGETAIAKMLEDAGGSHPKVTCPSDVELKKGVECECTTDIDGVSGRVKVTQTNDTGDVHFDMVEGYVFSAKLEQLIVDHLKQQTGVEGKVDCGERVHASKPGSTFHCTATPPSGDAVTIDVKINDAQGNVDWKIAGQEPTAPPTP